MIAAISSVHAFTLRYDKGEIIVLRLLRYALKGIYHVPNLNILQQHYRFVTMMRELCRYVVYLLHSTDKLRSLNIALIPYGSELISQGLSSDWGL
ncbi:hypothetical protein ANAPH1_00619 [Anaplasma phagocytophilum]|nr:hypothetical protein ANAPH1_00619 [Anaplasma phagocytophilum]